MRDQISRKTGNVAAFPLKLDLQLFADENDGTPNLEDSPEFAADAKEFNAKMESYTKERTTEKSETVEKPVEESDKAAKPDVATPDDKPKQDSETNKAFQEMRKKAEEAERRAAEVEAKARKADELIAQQYGKSHGIYTVEQYEQQLLQEKEQEENDRYEQAGLTADEIRKLREYDRLQLETETEKEVRIQQQKVSQWQQLYASYPELVDSANEKFTKGEEPEWFTSEMKAEIERGASPLAAYRNAHFETILSSKLKSVRDESRQDALDKMNSKDHLKATGTAGGDVDHVEIDDETMRMYRALNKGKTDAQIRAFHKKQLVGG